MDFRKEKGREIALLGRISKKGNVWLVPSQTRPGVKYKVTIDYEKPTCECADFATNSGKCKHIHAAIHRSEYPQTILIDPPTAPIEKKRKTYPQDWPNYNRGQTQEKDLLMRLLGRLCQTITAEEPKRPGRPRIPLADAAFLACYKVYERSSARRFMSDVGIARRSGLITCEPHFNSVLNAMNDSRMTQVLLDFIEITSSPLRGFEQTFAADSSGFTSSKYDRWIDIKSPALREEHTWTKVHVMCGTYTHVVTAVVIKDKHASDPKQFPALLKTTAANFDMREVYADKAYASIDNYQMCADHDVAPYIAFKSNHSGSGKGRSGKRQASEGGKLWAKMFHAFQFHREEFLAHYHQRSNVETVFSMIKAKFGGEVRSRTEIAALNEVLCKIVCHNICCLISAMFELGLDLDDLIAPKARRPSLQVIQGGIQ
ncbi:MAG: transposase [Rhizomicrobium sp.]